MYSDTFSGHHNSEELRRFKLLLKVWSSRKLFHGRVLPLGAPPTDSSWLLAKSVVEAVVGEDPGLKASSGGHCGWQPGVDARIRDQGWSHECKPPTHHPLCTAPFHLVDSGWVTRSVLMLLCCLANWQQTGNLSVVDLCKLFAIPLVSRNWQKAGCRCRFGSLKKCKKIFYHSAEKLVKWADRQKTAFRHCRS